MSQQAATAPAPVRVLHNICLSQEAYGALCQLAEVGNFSPQYLAGFYLEQAIFNEHAACMKVHSQDSSLPLLRECTPDVRTRH